MNTYIEKRKDGQNIFTDHNFLYPTAEILFLKLFPDCWTLFIDYSDIVSMAASGQFLPGV